MNTGINLHVSGKQLDQKDIRAAALEYVKTHTVHTFKVDCDLAIADFEAGAQWALSQVACASAKGGPAED